jgi:xanthine dehydrogenase accessory factor
VKEIRDIIHSFETANKAGKRTALATVVHVEGSSYRRPGARMLVTEEGQLTGAISGGCLEGDALRRALLAIHQHQKKLVTYDTTDEDDFQFGVQLGCNGIVHILFEPIDPKEPGNPIQLLERVLEKRRHAVLVTMFSMEKSASRQPGTCFLDLGNEIVHTPDTESLKNELANDCRQVLAGEASAIKTYNSGYEPLAALIEFIKPPVSLVIAGAGNDAMPLVDMACIMGWEITLVDGRPNYANIQRFPKAGKIIVAKPGNVLSQLEIDKQTAVILMTHNYQYDLSLLKQLLSVWNECVYIGSLGPRKKLERMFDELEREGTIYSQEQREKIFGPVGLDIGSETAEEIALSIMAEVKAALSGKTGRPLRERKEPIHEFRLEKNH